MKKKKILAVLVVCCVFTLVLACAGCGRSGGSSQPTPTPTPTEKASTSPFYVLVTGNDTRKGTVEITKPQYADGSAQTDTMMLLRVDPSNYLISIVTVPRDTAATIDGSTHKINEAYTYGGMPATVQQVEALTGIHVDYYLNMTFVQFEDFIDKMEGVTADVPINMSLADIVHGNMITLTEGPDQHLDGPEALVLARQRKQYANDIEACRQIQDRQIVQHLIEKVLAQPADKADTYASLMTAACDTDMTTAELKSYLALFMSNADRVTFQSGTGPYKGDIDPELQVWLTPRDEATWAELMQVVESGGDPTTVIELPEVLPAD